MVADLWTYLDTNNRYLTLRRFHILGGEPFLLSELDDCLEFWDTHGNPDLVLSIITNLNIPHKRFQKYLDRFEQLVKENKIWKFQITGSLDGWGPEIEYVRYGLDLNNWEKNFCSLLDKPWATLSINSAISALTIKQMPALIEKINQWNSLRGTEIRTDDNVFGEPIHYSFNTTGSYDNPYIFGKDIFDQDFNKILQLMSDKTETDRAVKLQIQSIADTLKKSLKDENKIKDLKNYLTLLDQRRNTNWKQTFPWLVDILPN
jgi:hypothetical protein